VNASNRAAIAKYQSIKLTAHDVAVAKHDVAGESQYDRIIEVDKETVCHYDGHLAIWAKPIRLDGLLLACRQINYSVDQHRTDGMRSTSRTFGSMPRRTLRQDFCHGCSMGAEHPEQDRVFRAYGVVAAENFRRAFPAKFLEQRDAMQTVKSTWMIDGTPFTSGIVNRNNVLRFHRDAGNVAGSWSMMFAMQDKCTGGLLVMPQFRVAFKFKSALIGFEGSRILHGVTPIQKLGPGGYRYSVVYYSLAQMVHCGTPAEELSRIRNLKTERERKRLK
jgi:hypothetical protein